MKIVAAALLLLALAGCVSVAKVETGDRPVGDRLVVTLDGPWNQLNAPNLGPAQTWTMEGLPVDQLLPNGMLVVAPADNTPGRAWNF